MAINREILNMYYGDHPADIATILKDFLDSYDEMVMSIEGAKQKDMQALRESLHFHSSIFAYIGMPELTEEFKKFEASCIAASLSEDDFTIFLQKVKDTKNIVQDEVNYFSSL